MSKDVPDEEDLPHSAIVAVIRISHSVRGEDTSAIQDQWVPKAASASTVVNVIEEVIPLKTPVECGGGQGLWPIPQEALDKVLNEVDWDRRFINEIKDLRLPEQRQLLDTRPGKRGLASLKEEAAAGATKAARIARQAAVSHIDAMHQVTHLQLFNGWYRQTTVVAPAPGSFFAAVRGQTEIHYFQQACKFLSLRAGLGRWTYGGFGSLEITSASAMLVFAPFVELKPPLLLKRGQEKEVTVYAKEHEVKVNANVENRTGINEGDVVSVKSYPSTPYYVFGSVQIRTIPNTVSPDSAFRSLGEDEIAQVRTLAKAELGPLANLTDGPALVVGDAASRHFLLRPCDTNPQHLANFTASDRSASG
jgi:hypothetical protein